MIGNPLNDHHCLEILHTHARQDAQNPVFQDLAAKFDSLEELRTFMRQLPFEPDVGNPRDGPRVPCRPPQRLRRLPSRLNCYENTLMYLTLAEILDPDTERTSATVRLDAGYHTFPVEDGQPVILDSVVPRNAAHAGLFHTTGQHHIAHPVAWVATIAQRALVPPIERERIRNGCIDLRDAVSLEGPGTLRNIATLLAVAEREAPLWGPIGHQAYATAFRALTEYWQLSHLTAHV